MARVVIASLALSLVGNPAFAQDPQDVLNRLIRQQQVEQQQRFEDQQRQRQLDQEEAAYDRQMCLKVGYAGPDVEQCIRDSAAWRRGVRPHQETQPDFAAYGTPASGTPQSAGLAHITLCAIVAQPGKFDNQGVALDGVVTDLRETTSQRRNDYTTFNLKDAGGCGAVTIFTWGHPPLTEGEPVHVVGLFEIEHHAGKYIFRNEISASQIISRLGR